jgi:hypothetical protein
LITALRFVIVKAAAFVYLPVQTGCAGVITLDAVHPKIVLAGLRMLRVNERQRDKRPAVFLPGGKNRQLVKARRSIHDLCDGRARGIARSQSQSFKRERTVLPERGGTWRQERFRDVHDFTHQRFRLRPESQLNAALRAKEIRHDRIAAALDVLEE